MNPYYSDDNESPSKYIASMLEINHTNNESRDNLSDTTRFARKRMLD